MRPDRVVALLGLSLLSIAAGARGLELDVAETYPLRGAPVEITLSGDGLAEARTIEVTYRPNSQTSHLESFDVTGSSLAWIPKDAGIVRLEIRDARGAILASRHVAVRFGGFPPSGIAVMLVAATLLFGGAALALVALLRKPVTPPESEAEPPST